MPTSPIGKDRASLLELWRAILTADADVDPATAVIHELSAYFTCPPDEVVSRCADSKTFSRQEWDDETRSTPDSLVRFWNSASPVFGITMSHAKQYHEDHPASSVDVAQALGSMPAGDLLDFGAGPGTSSMFFARLGWNVTFAEVSTTMLDFARWRAARRSIEMSYLDTATMPLPDAAFDLVTAFEVMAHVPDIPVTLAEIHDSLRPGGRFIFNVYAPPRSQDTFSHLYDANWPIIRHVRQTGFRRHARIGMYYSYEKVERGPLRTVIIRQLDRARYNTYVTHVGNHVRRARRHLHARRHRRRGRSRLL